MNNAANTITLDITPIPVGDAANAAKPVHAPYMLGGRVGNGEIAAQISSLHSVPAGHPQSAGQSEQVSSASHSSLPHTAPGGPLGTVVVVVIVVVVVGASSGQSLGQLS